MSYCRFSSDDWKCDVYVYANVSGFWTIHVAGRRPDWGDTVLPPPLTQPFDGDAWVNRTMEIQKLYDQMDFSNNDEPWIDLSAISPEHTGESYDEVGPAECADKLEEIKAAGLNVPQYAIDALREEAEESVG